MEWARGWPNRPDQDCAVIHNQRDKEVGGELRSSVIAQIPGFDKQRIFQKEAVLLELLKEELKENRPCILYVRQTITNDIRPRLERLIRENIEGAIPRSLPSSLDAEKREAHINQALKEGMNILITAPQLVATGLDLIDFKTIIWYESSYDLRLFSQASSRTLRANSDPNVALKTYYFFYEATMEERAFQIMSRKQRAAKLLTGDIGLSGLDELTADESNFEESLVNTLLNGSEALTDPSEALNQEVETDAILQADLVYWNPTSKVEIGHYELISPWQVLKNYFSMNKVVGQESHVVTIIEKAKTDKVAAALANQEREGKDKDLDLNSEKALPSLFTEKVVLAKAAIRLKAFQAAGSSEQSCLSKRIATASHPPKQSIGQ